jgi:RNA polymerase sigma factor (sigma-70 family)
VLDSSFDDFVRGHINALDRHAYALTGQRHAADDLVQETLIRLAGAWPRIREDGNPAGYATTVMFRAYISSWRTRRRRPDTVELAAEPLSGSDEYATVDTRLLLRQGLATLPKLQRAVLVATYLHDLNDDEIAQLIARAPATVRSLRHRGLRALSVALGHVDQGAETTVALTTVRGVNHGESRIASS